MPKGGEEKAKYGNSLIKEWSKVYSERFGKFYNESNLKRYRQFYLIFQKSATVWHRLNWSQVKMILPIKDESKRNYYINEVIVNNLSVRELDRIIKNNSYERLSYKDKNNIKLIEDDNYTLTIEDMIKDPIIINTNKSVDDLDEKALHRLIIEMLEEKFLELGASFALVGHEYKINIDNKTYKIDLLFFNIKLNAYVVVEVKQREIIPQDISQVDFYVKLVDKCIKEKNNNKTIGLLLVKKKNKIVIEYSTNHDLYITTYKILNKTK